MGRKACLGIALLALAPVSVSANAGTPLMWGTMLHLVFGNALIGAGEGFLLARVFKVPFLRAFLGMLGANYASTWVGYYLIRDVPNMIDMDLQSVRFWLWSLVGAAYVGTLLFELPFVYLALGETKKRFLKALGGNWIVQTASYGVLFWWYWGAGDVSLLRDLQTVRLSEMNAPTNILLYCIPTGLEDVCVGHLDDGHFIQIETLPRKGMIDRLAVEPAGTNWNLVALDEQVRLWPLLTNQTSRAVSDLNLEGNHGPTFMNFGYAAILLTNSLSTNVRFLTGYYPMEGVTVERIGASSRERYSLEAPFAAWEARNATVLPNGQLVFQLGKDQICLLDVERKQIALVVRGRGPVVAMERE